MQNLCYLARRIKHDALIDRVADLGSGNAARDAKIAALYPKNDSGGLEEAKDDLVEALLSIRDAFFIDAIDAIEITDLPVCGRDDISACRAEVLATTITGITAA